PRRSTPSARSSGWAGWMRFGARCGWSWDIVVLRAGRPGPVEGTGVRPEETGVVPGIFHGEHFFTSRSRRFFARRLEARRRGGGIERSGQFVESFLCGASVGLERFQAAESNGVLEERLGFVGGRQPQPGSGAEE